MNEPKIYYAEENLQDMLEVSDRHMLWEVNIHNVLEEKNYYIDCDYAIAKLSKHYHTAIGRFGRSGRHVCIPDTPANRRNYRHIVAAVEREQNRIIKMFS